MVDTSVALVLLIEGHEQNAVTVAAVSGLRLGPSGHAAFETCSVLTRMPPPARRSAEVVAKLVEVNFPATRHLTPERASFLLTRLAALRIAGGAVYDAMVGETAREHDLRLLTRNARAAATYRALQVRFELIA